VSVNSPQLIFRYISPGAGGELHVHHLLTLTLTVKPNPNQGKLTDKYTPLRSTNYTKLEVRL